MATLIVPVFLGPDEDENEMLTSDAYGTLAKILGALRAHDTGTVEALPDPRLRAAASRGRQGVELTDEESELSNGGQIDAEGQEQEDEGAARVSAAAAGVLRFSTERDPATVAAFVRLRVIDPERAYWRRGIAAAQRWRWKTGPQDWSGTGLHPLGAWLADQRRYYAAGTLEAERVAELEKLGMIWSVYTEWDGMLSVTRSYAEVHGRFVPPATVVWEGQPIGVWAKNQRQAARKAAVNAARRAAGETCRALGSCLRAAGRPWKRSTRAGVRCGMRDGSASTGCARHT